MTDEYDRPRKLYRVRTGIGLGVCHGIAEYFDFPVWLVQAAALITCLAMHIVPFLILYGIAALIMKPKPGYEHPHVCRPARREFESTSRAASWHEIKDIMARLDRRIKRMENVVK
ncbi:MAG: PspC domain-containing protein [Candidatus Hydrogenedentes bacterium]|nr:PspC domain-containing protein [Candidatus Hydrogenedentota bacterium]